MNVAEKLTFIKSTQFEIISSPDDKFRKLKDLLLCCSDPKDIDVVIKALKSLCDVFSDILPGYRIRENKQENEDSGQQHNTDTKVSRDVQSMRDFENFILDSYKEYLKILEVFSKTKPEKLIRQKGI